MKPITNGSGDSLGADVGQSQDAGRFLEMLGSASPNGDMYINITNNNAPSASGANGAGQAGDGPMESLGDNQELQDLMNKLIEAIEDFKQEGAGESESAEDDSTGTDSEEMSLEDMYDEISQMNDRLDEFVQSKGGEAEEAGGSDGAHGSEEAGAGEGSEGGMSNIMNLMQQLLSLLQEHFQGGEQASGNEGADTQVSNEDFSELFEQLKGNLDNILEGMEAG